MENYTFMGGIWREHAEHRQTQPYSFVNSNGSACDAWLTETTASNNCVLDGTVYQGSATPQVIQGRDFLTSSTAGALYGEVQGRFFDDALKVNLGLTYRYIQRSMHDYLPICATGESARRRVRRRPTGTTPSPLALQRFTTTSMATMRQCRRLPRTRTRNGVRFCRN